MGPNDYSISVPRVVYRAMAWLILLLPCLGAKADAAATPVFTLQQLAEYDGQNGQPAYVAVNGLVYDVTDAARWEQGQHFECYGAMAGRDITALFAQSPHGAGFLSGYQVVGRLIGGAAGNTGADNRGGENEAEAEAGEGGPFAGRPAPPQANAGPVLSRDQAHALGWLAVLLAAVSALYYPVKRVLAKALKLGGNEAGRNLAGAVKRLMAWHCWLALAAAMLVFLHAVDWLRRFRLTAGYIALILFYLIVLTGIVRKYLRKRKKLALFAKHLHVYALIAFCACLLYHVAEKVF